MGGEAAVVPDGAAEVAKAAGQVQAIEPQVAAAVDREVAAIRRIVDDEGQAGIAAVDGDVSVNGEAP